MKLKMKTPFGARIIKTGVAVGVALYVASLLQVEPKIFAAVSAVMNIQPSIYRSFMNAWEQILSHLISVTIAIAFGYLVGSGPIEMAVATVLVITINKKFGFKQSIGMAVVAAIFVLDAPQSKFLMHALDRSYIIFIGLAAALLVNIIVLPPKYKNRLTELLRTLNDEMAAFFEQSVRDFINLERDPDKFYAKREEVKNLIRKSREYLELYKEQLGGDAPNDQRVKIYERYIDYNSNLYHSSRDTYIATEQRISWRVERGDPPITDDFKDVLKTLEHGLASFNYLNYELQKAVLDNEEPKLLPVDDSLWEELSLHVDKWHVHITGANFLHAFMNVSAVAYDIKLACRGIKQFLSDIYNINNSSKESESS
ncbi:MAG: membrane-like protein [Firmicutes bacterium]|nr:membrane-like protein [Bacillota bacterium]